HVRGETPGENRRAQDPQVPCDPSPALGGGSGAGKGVHDAEDVVAAGRGGVADDPGAAQGGVAGGGDEQAPPLADGAPAAGTGLVAGDVAGVERQNGARAGVHPAAAAVAGGGPRPRAPAAPG